jgi:hypothetical protein
MTQKNMGQPDIIVLVNGHCGYVKDVAEVFELSKLLFCPLCYRKLESE